MIQIVLEYYHTDRQHMASMQSPELFFAHPPPSIITKMTLHASSEPDVMSAVITPVLHTVMSFVM